jgi:hypothetical protein
MPHSTVADLSMSSEQFIISPREERCLASPQKSAFLVAESEVFRGLSGMPPLGRPSSPVGGNPGVTLR